MGHEDNIWLTRLFTMTELEEAMREMKTSTALGPDGFFTSFYKNFRGQVRGVILEMLQLLHRGQFDIARLNYGIIVLLPKNQKGQPN